MANELNLQLDPSSQTGLSVVADIKNAAGVSQGTVALTEVGADAYYTGNAPALSDGSYTVVFEDDTGLLGLGILHWQGGAEVNIRTLALDVAGLNDVSSADVVSATSASLVSYGAATNATVVAGDNATAALVSALNDVSQAEVLAQVTAGLVAYGAATGTDLTTVSAIVEEISKLTGNRVVVTGEQAVVYEDDGVTPYRVYNLAGGGREPV